MAASATQASSLARTRLTKERKEWRKEHPPGFYARPERKADGSTDILSWTAGIPGKAGTPWEGGVYKLSMQFPPDYPSKPPKCQFTPPLFHPNVYPSGTVCLSILNEEHGWKPTLTFKSVLENIQNLLDDHNLDDPAHREAFKMARDAPAEYAKKAREQAETFAPR